MTEVNLNNVLSERSNAENEEDSSHGFKKSKKLSSEVLFQKVANLTRNKRKGNDVAHLLLFEFVFHVDEEKREVRSKAKKDVGEDPEFVFVFIVFSLLES